jgi:Putative bacterial sensory transduction regulator
MRAIVKGVLIVAAALGFGGAAQAQMVVSQNPQSVAAAMQAAGYRAELSADDSGDPMIRSTSSGTNFAVFFYGCTKNTACSTVAFAAAYGNPAKGNLAAINAWNSKARFGRGYLSDTGQARLEMDVDLDDGGISRLLFTDNLEFWVAVMASFEKDIVNK